MTPLEKALERAFYQTKSDGSVLASVPGIRGVFGLGADSEEAKDELTAAVEEWIEERAAKGLALPPTLR